MRNDKEKAIELRRQKNSYAAISRELNIPKGTLSGWFKREIWSREIRNELGRAESLASPKKLEKVTAANKKRWADWHQKARDEAVMEFPKLKNSPLFLAGLMLYWGEGEKQQKSSIVRLGNSDPEMLRTYYLFLTKALKVTPARISASLLLYPDLVDSVQKNFWSRATGIPIQQFKKSIYIKGRHPTRRLSYGVCTIVVSSRVLKERMLKWIELYQDFLRSYALKIAAK